VLAVVLSFVVVTIVVRRPPPCPVMHPADDPQPGTSGGMLGLVGVATLTLIVATGIAGSQIDRWNPAPVVVALLFGGLLPLAQLTAGDVWSRVSPWPAAIQLFAGWRRPPAPLPPVPATAVGAWPAAAFLAMLLVAVTSTSPWSPRAVAFAVLSYAALTWTAMLLFGAAWWLRHGEVVTVVARLFAALSVRRRPFAAGLFGASAGAGTVVLVVLLVAGGFLQALVRTRVWETAWQSLGVQPGDLGRAHVAAALIVVTTLVASTYGSACVAVRAAIPDWPVRDITRAFALALVPVAALFHVAAGIEHVVVDAQQALRLASDPFGLGTNVLGTRSWPIVPLDAVIVWHVQLVLVVLAHVVAVYVAHVRALVLLDRPRLAMLSQVPMLLLMLLYTVTGLWLLSTVPIVVGDEPGAHAR
jgi:hypothetical protein